MLGDCCPFCRGAGKVQVILPGPKRPVRVWGVVLNVRNAEDSDLLYGPRTIRSIPSPFGEESRIRGAIANATVVFRRTGAEGDGSETVVTRSSGRFSQRLAPGVYAVKASAPGFEPFEGELTVEPLVEPIWMEKATLVQEPGSSDEARSLYGLHCIAALDTTGGDGGSIRLVPGEP